VSELVQKYLDDIRIRENEANFGEPEASVVLRKSVLLGEINTIINNI